MALPLINLSSVPTLEECPAIGYMAWYESYLTKDVLAGLVALMSINTITAILAVLLNALVIYMVVRRPQMRSNAKILLACLAGNDLLTGALVQPLQIAREARHVLSTGPYCDVDIASLTAVHFSALTSLSQIALVTIDRYIAIKFPLEYRSVMTRRRLIRGVVIVWAVPLTYIIAYACTLAIFGGKTTSSVVVYLDLYVACTMFLSLVVIVYMNAAILAETRRHRKRLERLQNELTRQEETRKLKRKDRATKTVAIVVSVLVLSYIPVLIIVAFRGLVAKVVHRRILYVLFTAAITTLQLSSFLNPLIYCWRIREFRDAFFELLPSCHLQSDSTEEDKEMQCPNPSFHPSISAVLPLPTVEQDPMLLSFANFNTVESVL